MYKNSKIILFAFGSLDLKKSADRLKNQAINSKYYDEIRILNPKNFDNQMKIKFDELRKNKCGMLQNESPFAVANVLVRLQKCQMA